jgi:hypothetical protein
MSLQSYLAQTLGEKNRDKSLSQDERELANNQYQEIRATPVFRGLNGYIIKAKDNSKDGDELPVYTEGTLTKAIEEAYEESTTRFGSTENVSYKVWIVLADKEVDIPEHFYSRRLVELSQLQRA